jgi:hypothetical protein
VFSPFAETLLTKCKSRRLQFLSRGFAPRTPLLALSLAAAPARSDREARSRRSLAPQDGPSQGHDRSNDDHSSGEATERRFLARQFTAVRTAEYPHQSDASFVDWFSADRTRRGRRYRDPSAEGIHDHPILCVRRRRPTADRPSLADGSLWPVRKALEGVATVGVGNLQQLI